MKSKLKSVIMGKPHMAIFEMLNKFQIRIISHNKTTFNREIRLINPKKCKRKFLLYSNYKEKTLHINDLNMEPILI